MNYQPLIDTLVEGIRRGDLSPYTYTVSTEIAHLALSSAESNPD